MPITTTHEHFMQIALNYGYRMLGNTQENPSVGCIIVKNECIIGADHTSPEGRPHAEVNALNSCTTSPKNATLYVTLEPCCHHGKSPPCTDAIINAGIDHVVIGCLDSNPQISGKGITQLRNAGITVTTNILNKACKRLHQGFLLTQTHNRPEVTLKLAFTKDGKITVTPAGWFTNVFAKQIVHKLRSQHNAILVGKNTYLHDKPQLNCRLKGLEQTSPKRYILSNSTLGIEPSDPIAPATVISTENIHDFLKNLSQTGITRLMVEGGSITAERFLEARIVDTIYMFTANDKTGNPQTPNIRNKINPLLVHHTLEETRKLDNNTLHIYTQ